MLNFGDCFALTTINTITKIIYQNHLSRCTNATEQSNKSRRSAPVMTVAARFADVVDATGLHAAMRCVYYSSRCGTRTSKIDPNVWLHTFAHILCIYVHAHAISTAGQSPCFKHERTYHLAWKVAHFAIASVRIGVRLPTQLAHSWFILNIMAERELHIHIHIGKWADW